MTNKNEIKSVKETLLPAVPSEDHQLTFEVIDTESGIPQLSLSEFKEMNEQLDRYLSYAEKYKYSSEDRQDIKKLKAKINAFKTASNKQKNAIRDFTVTPLVEQRDVLIEKMNELASFLSDGLDAEDKKNREEKQNEISTLFKSAKRSYESIADNDEVLVEDISDRSWLNISTSINKISKEIGGRTRAIHNVKTSVMLPEEKADIRLIINTLKDNDWDAMETVNFLVSQYKEEQEEAENARLLKEAREREAAEKAAQRAEQEAAKKAAQAEKDTSQPETPPKPNTLFEIKDGDVIRVKKLLDHAGIKYTTTQAEDE